jgi:sulfite reductase alpha subunit-like flavoprotein
VVITNRSSIDGTFLSWSIDLGKHLLSLFPLSDGQAPIPPDVFLPPKHFLELVNEDIISPDQLEPISPSLTPASTSDATTTTAPSSSHTSPDHPQARATSSVPFSAPAQPQTTNGPRPDSGLASKHEGDAAKMDHTSLLQLEPRPCPQIRESIPGVPDPVDRVHPRARLLPWPDAVEATLVSNVRITPANHWQDVRELTFHMSRDTRYLPGDVLTIYPKNFPEDVQALIDLMGWNKIADERVSFQPTSPDYYNAENLTSMVPGLYPSPRTTIRNLLTHNLDITAIPKRSFFDFISHQTSDLIHRARLSEFSNPAYTDEFFDYATRPRRSILEVLQDFPSVRIPWKWATSVFPVIRGRQYSISSGGDLKFSRHNKDVVQVHLLVAIVKYRTVLKKIRQGLCSRYIASLPEGTRMNVGLTANSSFSDHTKYQPNYPVILIGPGTGLAPLRSLIWERAAMKMHDEELRAKTMLFYGGRNRSADFFYNNEWSDGRLGVSVRTAFSRDQKEKIYIQDIIRRDGKTVWELLQKNAVVYVCGSSGNMPKAAREAIIDVMAQHGTFTNRAAAEVAVADMVRRGHYVQETW